MVLARHSVESQRIPLVLCGHMNGGKQELIQMIRERSFRLTESPTFRLSSGAMSRFYFNMKPVTYSPMGLKMIGELYLKQLDEVGLRPDAIGGLTMGADPIAAAVARASCESPPLIEAFVIRKEPKQHGTAQQLEGYVKAGDRVVIVDDVVTTGASTIKAIRAAEAQDVKIVGVVVLLDRGEQNGMQNIVDCGYPAYSLLNIRDFVNA